MLNNQLLFLFKNLPNIVYKMNNLGLRIYHQETRQYIVLDTLKSEYYYDSRMKENISK